MTAPLLGDDTIDALCCLLAHEQGSEAIQQRIYELGAQARLANSRQWVPVSERLPEHENDVLIHHVLGDDTRAYDVACYIGGAWVFPWGKEISPHWVTHWQHLPEPPGGETK